MITPATIAAGLHAAVDEALRLFSSADERRTTLRSGPDQWSAREVLGHLIDSAVTNHRRFILAQSPNVERFDGYDQNVWVARNHYHEAPWRDLVALWTAYNRHLAHVIASAPAATLTHTAISPDGTRQLTLGFVMEDYVAHLRHHLAQIKTLLAPA